MKKLKKIEEKIKVAEGVKVELDKDSIIVSYNNNSSKIKKNALINIDTKNDELTLTAKNKTKRGKKIVGTYKAHIKNIINGLKEPYKYILKICSGHFPMNVSANNDELIVKNFLGEKTPRVLKLKKNINVKVEGDQVIVESIDKKLAGQTAADIEKLCKITNRDPRIFQDGIWIINKAGKEIK